MKAFVAAPNQCACFLRTYIIVFTLVWNFFLRVWEWTQTEGVRQQDDSERIWIWERGTKRRLQKI